MWYQTQTKIRGRIILKIYFIFSATPFFIGKVIRHFTKERFNHVSISFYNKQQPESIQHAYTFARRHINAPFYGGLVRDCSDRYILKGRRALVNIYEIDVSNETYFNILKTVQAMYCEKDEYIYNLFSAFCFPKKRVFIKNSFTCLEFASFILSYFSDIDKNGIYSFSELESIMNGRCIYSGEYNFSIPDSDGFCTRMPFFLKMKCTFKQIIDLVKRHPSFSPDQC